MRTTTCAEPPGYVTEPVTRGALAARISATSRLPPTDTVKAGRELVGTLAA
jgi:hypothetical protein